MTTLTSVTATFTPSARWMPVSSTLCVAAIAPRIGMPTVSATCWVIEVSPVASPCSWSGRPAVPVTV
jgi:hypothetical protein